MILPLTETPYTQEKQLIFEINSGNRQNLPFNSNFLIHLAQAIIVYHDFKDSLG